MPMRAQPITPERIERALDTLANVMVRSGPEGRVYLPLFENLEQELAKLRAEEDVMSRVRARAKR
jgi:hypothetical protein